MGRYSSISNALVQNETRVCLCHQSGLPVNTPALQSAARLLCRLCGLIKSVHLVCYFCMMYFGILGLSNVLVTFCLLNPTTRNTRHAYEVLKLRYSSSSLRGIFTANFFL